GFNRQRVDHMELLGIYEAYVEAAAISPGPDGEDRFPFDLLKAADRPARGMVVAVGSDRRFAWDDAQPRHRPALFLAPGRGREHQAIHIRADQQLLPAFELECVLWIVALLRRHQPRRPQDGDGQAFMMPQNLGSLVDGAPIREQN